MQCYTELTPPTAVSHSLRLPFISADSNNLIVAKTSLLQIFSFKTISIEADEPTEEQKSAKQNKGHDRRATDDESTFLGPDAISRPPPRFTRTKLVLIAEYTLSGTVTSLARIKTLSSKSGGEALLVGFKDAKLSLVEWDPERPGISTISIHYYEQDDLHGSPWTTDVGDCINYLTADPGNRCAALKFGARNLAILPFKQGDEDVNMADWDEELDGPRPESQAAAKTTNGDGNKADTPYGASFVLRLPTLNLNLIYPIHLAFLYEYREPTFGILSSNQLPAASLLHERKDHLSYMVFTLDLHQKASTPILSVGGLPFDLFKIVPLPAPVGGALLVGGNELIHIDQAGKANGVAVNPFAKQSTSFALVNQADLDMRLESCEIEQLSIQNGEMLIILQSGELAILSFRMDGRSVSGLSIRRVAKESGGLVLSSGASTISQLGTSAMFVGSEGTESIVLGWTRKSNQISRRKSRLDFIEGIDEALLAEEEEEDDDPDDELYGVAPTTTQAAANPAEATSSKAGDYIFQIHDSLVNIAPIIDVVLGSSAPYETDEEKRTSEDVRSDLQLVAATGKGRGGSLAIIHRNIQPKVMGKFEFAEARGLWTMSAKRPTVKGLQASKEKTALSGDYGNEAQFDRLMIVSKKIDETEKSDVYVLTNAGFEELTTPEYSSDVGATIEAGTLGNGMRIIQVVKKQVRVYDGDLGLAQILEMEDEDTGVEPNIVSASLADPFILLIRDDASIYVANCDESYDLEEVEREDEALLTTKWLTGCLYKDTTGAFSSGQVDEEQGYGKNVMMFLLSAGGALHIYALPDLSKPVYVAEGLCFVPPVLSADYAARRSAARETLTEIIVADLGDSISKSPYLIVRPSADDLTIYEPFQVNSKASPKSLSSSLQFLKIHNPHLAKNPEVSALETAEDGNETRNEPMRAMENVGGYSTVFLPGASPSFIIKSAKSTPKVMGLQGVGVRGMSSFHTSGCDRGFIYTDFNGVARVAQLPENTDFAQLGVSLQKVPLNEDLHGLAYHPPMECYVAATSTRVEFDLPKDDDYRRDWQREDISFKPTMEQGYLRLVNPINWTVIDTVTMDPFEVIMCVKTLNLEVSESTNERKQLITVGTAISRGEDLPIKGRIYVFDVVNVIPEPDRPETNKRLKLIAREEIPRGAITGVSEIGTQGFMLVAQGQKCMVRGLKEDGTLLPVAFMDMNCYVTAVKELRGTGLCVLSDAVKGVWFVGYTEEPYKMLLFGKSSTKMEILTADLLPDGKELYIVAADADCNLHVMQFDPEHPKSLHGHLLLHRTTFSLGGHLPTTLTLLPRTTPSTMLPPSRDASTIAAEATIPSQQLLITSTTGTIAILSSLSESQYRRLSTLASHLTNTLYHPCGLNPRAYRVDRDAPEGITGGRAVVDGGILGRWCELGSQRRAEVAGRVGFGVLEVRVELAALQGGLGYL